MPPKSRKRTQDAGATKSDFSAPLLSSTDDNSSANVGVSVDAAASASFVGIPTTQAPLSASLASDPSGSLQSDAIFPSDNAAKAPELPLSPRGMLIVYTVINLLSYFDRGALSSCLEDIGASFDNLSGAKKGFLGSAFMVGYMTASPIFAHFVTKFEPFRVMALGLFIWVLATLLCCFSPSYWLVLVGRVLTGFGEASFLCIAPPFIDRFAPKGGKSLWLSVFYSAIPVGYALGFLASGIWLGAHPMGDNSWRAIFGVEAAAMVPFVLFSLTGNSPYSFSASSTAAAEPAILDSDPNLRLSAASDPSAAPEGPLSPTTAAASEAKRFTLAVRVILGNKLFFLVVLGYAMQTFVTGGMAFFGLDYAKEELGLSKTAAGMGFGAVTVLTGILGTMAGGLIMDYLRARRGIPSALRRRQADAAAIAAGDDLALLDAHLETHPAEDAASTAAEATALTGAPDAPDAVEETPEEAAANEAAANDLQNPVNVRDRVESSLVAVKFVCTVTLISVPFAVCAFALPSTAAFFIFLPVTEFFLFCCFSPLNNCIMWTVPFSLSPQALALSVIFSHALGDALSPTIIGVLLDATNRKWRLVMLVCCSMLLMALLFWGIGLYFASQLNDAVSHFPYSLTGHSTTALAQSRRQQGLRTSRSGAAFAPKGQRPARSDDSAGYLDAAVAAEAGQNVGDEHNAEQEALVGPFIYVRNKLKWSMVDKDTPGAY